MKSANYILTKKNLCCIAILQCLLMFTACTEEKAGVAPSSLSNLRTEERPGGIFVAWDIPSDHTVRYVKVSYYDHLLQKEVHRLSSTDTILLPNTRQKYGEYKLAIQPFSHTDIGGSVEYLSGVSGKAPVMFLPPLPLELKVSDLSTNAQEPTGSPIDNLLDNNTNTFFHTAWTQSIPAPHWMQVDLPREITKFYSFYYAPRSNANNKPVDFDLLGSNDGTTWFLLKNFTKEADNLPTTSSGTYRSEVLETDKPFKQIRFSVKQTNNNTVYWTMSEFKFYVVETIDPEL